MSDGKLHLSIAPRKDVVRDLKRNCRWIAGIAGGWLSYLLLSSFVACIWEEWSYLEACYFTVINMTTVGFGEIVPSTPQTRFLAGVNGVFGLLAFGTWVASITIAFQPSSFAGSLALSPPSSARPEPGTANETATVQDATGTLVQALADLIAATDREGENQHDEKPSHTVRRSVDVDVVADKGEGPKIIHLHVRIRS